MAAPISEEGVRRASILLMTLGEDAAVEVFKYLGPKEVQKLGFTMAGMENVKREEVDTVLGDFIASTQNRANLGAADEYIRSVLTKALARTKPPTCSTAFCKATTTTASNRSSGWIPPPWPN